jgi:hypothetical protein
MQGISSLGINLINFMPGTVVVEDMCKARTYRGWEVWHSYGCQCMGIVFHETAVEHHSTFGSARLLWIDATSKSVVLRFLAKESPLTATHF